MANVRPTQQTKRQSPVSLAVAGRLGAMPSHGDCHGAGGAPCEPLRRGRRKKSRSRERGASPPGHSEVTGSPQHVTTQLAFKRKASEKGQKSCGNKVASLRLAAPHKAAKSNIPLLTPRRCAEHVWIFGDEIERVCQCQRRRLRMWPHGHCKLRSIASQWWPTA